MAAIRSSLKLPMLPPRDEDDSAIEELDAELMIEGMHVSTLEDF